MPFSQRVGLSFNESMSGHVPAGVADPDLAPEGPINFKFALGVDIPSLRDFLDAPPNDPSQYRAPDPFPLPFREGG